MYFSGGVPSTVVAFTDEMMIQWKEILVIARTTNFYNEQDQLIWYYATKGVYSSGSLYVVINFRGVKPIYLPSVWYLKIFQGFKSSCGFYHNIKL
jgi:hypothetical protein